MTLARRQEGRDFAPESRTLRRARRTSKGVVGSVQVERRACRDIRRRILMPDMLVQLLKLPPLEPLGADLRAQGVVIRRANPFEITPIRAFILEHFGAGWAD